MWLLQRPKLQHWLLSKRSSNENVKASRPGVSARLAASADSAFLLWLSLSMLKEPEAHAGAIGGEEWPGMKRCEVGNPESLDCLFAFLGQLDCFGALETAEEDADVGPVHGRLGATRL